MLVKEHTQCDVKVEFVIAYCISFFVKFIRIKTIFFLPQVFRSAECQAIISIPYVYYLAMFHREVLSKLANSYFVFVQWTIIGIFGRSLSYRLYLISTTLNSSYTYRNFSSLLQPIFIQLAHIVILLRRCCIQHVPWELWVYGRECIFNNSFGW